MKCHLQIPMLVTGLAAAALLTSACAESRAPLANGAASIDAGIIGGKPVAAGDEITKSAVGIEATGHGVFCTGVLLAKNLVVTAGHCTGLTVRPSEMQIVFGNDLNGKLQKRRVQGGKVTDQWPQLTQEQEKNWGDIALLRFEGEAPVGYEPIPSLSSAKQLKDGMNVVIAGYGFTKMNPPEEPEKLMKTTVQLSDVHFSETELKLEQAKGKGACHGDSGGPAYARINNKLFLIGVTSRSATMAGASTCMEGSIYTSIAGQIEFLKSAARYLNSKAFVPNDRIPQPEVGM